MTAQKTIQSNQQLLVTDANRGEYLLNFNLFSPDQSDALNLEVTKGRLSVFANGAWTPVPKVLSLPNIESRGGALRLRVDRTANLSFRLVDSFTNPAFNDVPTNPTARLQLTGLESSLDMGDRRSSAWNMGRIDRLTGLEWNEGIVDRAASSFRITESIGGDDVSDYARFSLSKAATVRIETEGAIAQLLNSKGMVVADSSDGYESLLTANLKRGTYYLGFSSESSIAQAFTASIALG